MFNKKKQPPIRSLIAEDSEIEGNLKFTDGLRIDGKVRGNVSARAEAASILVISETGAVTGELIADHIIVNGTVRGPVHARVMLELQPKARIEGEVYYTALEMHQGAILDGPFRPGVEEEKPTLKWAANNRQLNG